MVGTRPAESAANSPSRVRLNRSRRSSKSTSRSSRRLIDSRFPNNDVQQGSLVNGGPLADITVVDLTRALAGPHAAMMLADLGARVIKVETPGNGDDTRGWGPPFVGPPTADAETISTYFLSCNRNKQSLVLDLKSDDGRVALAELVRRSDVLLENFRPGVLDRLGFSMQRLTELNPALVVLSISDLLAGMYGAFGVVAKLHERGRTGLGGLVRTSLLASVIGVHAYQGTRWTVAGEVPKAEGPHHPSICPYGLFHSSDGIVQIAVGSEGLWAKFAPAFDIPADGPEFSTNPNRVRNGAVVRAAVEQAFAEYETAELLEKLAQIGVPSGEVKNLQQVYEWDQTRSQGLLIDVDHPVLGEIQLPGPPLRFFEPSGTEWHRQHTAPPLLGQHTDEVLAWLTQPQAGQEV